MKIQPRFFSVCLVFAIAFSLIAFGPKEKILEAAHRPGTIGCITSLPYKQGELLVRFSENAPDEAREAARSIAGATMKKDLRNGMELLRLPEGMSVSTGLSS